MIREALPGSVHLRSRGDGSADRRQVSPQWDSGPDRFSVRGQIRYEYDTAGRMVLRQKTRLSRKPDTWHYTWDAENRLTSCRTPDGVTWRYEYDPLGRRTAKHRMAPDGRSVEQSVYFTWDGTRLAEQTDTATATTVTWEYDAHESQPIGKAPSCSSSSTRPAVLPPSSWG